MRRLTTRLSEGAVAIEVSGRPVFLLAGPLPMYRTLRPGLTGNDVRQLEQALRRLRLFRGTPDAAYDAATEAALTKLYRNTGYEPVGPSPQEAQQIAGAEAQLAAARAALREAEAGLAEASRPPRGSEVLAAKSAVEQARAARGQAVADLQAGRAAGLDPPAIAALEGAVRAAESELAVAEAQLAELRSTPDTTTQRRAVDDARAGLKAAESALTEARRAAGVRLPRGEVVFVPSLPRRVHQVQAKAGGPPGSPAFSLTAASLQVDSSVSLEEQKLIEMGAAARLDDQAAGLSLTGTVTEIASEPGTGGAPSGSFRLRVTPSGGDPQQLAGLNLRVTIPIESTDGEVLAVPLAALVTDAGGMVRVRTVRADGPVDVEVTPGLAADGFVEVTPAGGDLREGDLVVVGERR